MRSGAAPGRHRRAGPAAHPRRGRAGRPRLRRGARAGPAARRGPGGAAEQRQQHVRQPVAAQPGARRAAAAADRAAGEQRAGPGPAVEPLPARPPRHPHAAQQREPAGAGRHGPRQAERGAGAAGRRAARRGLGDRAVPADRRAGAAAGHGRGARHQRRHPPAGRAARQRDELLAARFAGRHVQHARAGRLDRGRDRRLGRGHGGPRALRREPAADHAVGGRRLRLAAHGPVRGGPPRGPARHHGAPRRRPHGRPRRRPDGVGDAARPPRDRQRRQAEPGPAPRQAAPVGAGRPRTAFRRSARACRTGRCPRHAGGASPTGQPLDRAAASTASRPVRPARRCSRNPASEQQRGDRRPRRRRSADHRAARHRGFPAPAPDALPRRLDRPRAGRRRGRRAPRGGADAADGATTVAPTGDAVPTEAVPITAAGRRRRRPRRPRSPERTDADEPGRDGRRRRVGATGAGPRGSAARSRGGVRAAHRGGHRRRSARRRGPPTRRRAGRRRGPRPPRTPEAVEPPRTAGRTSRPTRSAEHAGRPTTDDRAGRAARTRRRRTAGEVAAAGSEAAQADDAAADDARCADAPDDGGGRSGRPASGPDAPPTPAAPARPAGPNGTLPRPDGARHAVRAALDDGAGRERRVAATAPCPRRRRDRPGRGPRRPDRTPHRCPSSRSPTPHRPAVRSDEEFGNAPYDGSAQYDGSSPYDHALRGATARTSSTTGSTGARRCRTRRRRLFAASVPAIAEPDGLPRSRRPLAEMRRGPVDLTETTPIFAEIASAWFASRPPGARSTGSWANGPATTWLPASAPAPAARAGGSVRAGLLDGPDARPCRRRRRSRPARRSPASADEGWRAASGAAAERPDELTAAGLPKRRPRARLVPGSAGSAVLAAPASPTRSAESVRGRLASYQQGVRQGREIRLRRDPGRPGPQPVSPGENAAASGSGEHDEETR